MTPASASPARRWRPPASDTPADAAARTTSDEHPPHLPVPAPVSRRWRYFAPQPAPGLPPQARWRGEAAI